MKRFHVSEADVQDSFLPRFNLAPSEPGLVVVEEGGRRVMRPMHFGLIPHWAKDPKIAFQCLNARSETITSKPAFRESFAKRRGLIVCDGFYEWRAEGKVRQPFRTTLSSKQPFALAGLWDRWKRPDGKEMLTFCIVTTQANDLLRTVHERMPVILREEDEPVWLAPYVTESKTLLPLLRSYDPTQLAMTRVSTVVNKSGHNNPACIEPLVD